MGVVVLLAAMAVAVCGVVLDGAGLGGQCNEVDRDVFGDLAAAGDGYSGDGNIADREAFAVRNPEFGSFNHVPAGVSPQHMEKLCIDGGAIGLGEAG